MKIDYNRGVVKRIHGASGVSVYMYKDDPGVFLNQHGGPVDEALAEAAGFDVERFTKERTRKDRLAEAERLINEELGLSKGRKVVETRAGYSLVDVGAAGFVIEDPDGLVLTPAPVSDEVAKSVFTQMAGPAEKPKSKGSEQAPA